MADGATPYYNLTLPEVGASADTWGTKTNSNWSQVDTDLYSLASTFGNYLPLAGGSLSGPLTVAAPGVSYGGTTGNHIAFGWDGNIQGYVDNTYIGELATVGWANSTFATYSWVNSNFPTMSASDARYLYKAGDTCTGSLTINGNMVSNGGLSVGSTIVSNGSLTSGGVYPGPSGGFWLGYQAGAPNIRFTTDGWHMYWDAGNLNYVSSGGVVLWQCDGAGNVHSPGQALFHNGVYGNTAQTLGMFTASGNASVQFASGFIFELINATGDLRWFSTGGQATFTWRYSDGVCYGNQAGLAGFGAYVNLSDARSKQDIAPATKGLDAILQLNPVSFRRIGLDGAVRQRQEIGLVAQEVQRIIPEAVAAMGIELRVDGLGGKDTDAPSLGLECDPLIAVLVNAVKELSARLAVLEGAARA